MEENFQVLRPLKEMTLDNRSKEAKSVPEIFKWKELPDRRWEFTGSSYSGTGYFLTLPYKGAIGGDNRDHPIRVGEVVSIYDGSCWKVNEKNWSSLFTLAGIVQGWYDDSEDVIVQITGIVESQSLALTPNLPVCLPKYFGKPEQHYPHKMIGIAVSPHAYLLHTLK